MPEGTSVKRQEDVYARIRDAWDSDADSYDSRPGHGILSHRERDAWRQVITASVAPLLTDRPLHVADVGSGTGVMALILAEMGHDVTAVDLSPRMLDQGRAKARDLGLRIDFVEGNATKLPFAAESMDVVFSRHLFWTLPDPVGTLLEWVRVVRPGGMLAIADGWWDEPTPAARRRRAIGKAVRAALQQMPPDHAGYKDLQSALPVSGGVSPYTIRYYLDQAGLERLRVRDLRSIRAAERRALPLWFWIDRARYTWLATGYKPA